MLTVENSDGELAKLQGKRCLILAGMALEDG